jgi:hypothetical protein
MGRRREERQTPLSALNGVCRKSRTITLFLPGAALSSAPTSAFGSFAYDT